MDEKIVEFLRKKDYRLIRNIGRGGTAITVLLKDELIDKEYVCKKYLPLKGIDPKEYFNNFLTEIKLLHEISHPNIVRVYNYYLYPERYTGYLLMEHIDGETISDFISKNPEKINSIFEQTINGFKYLEEHNILHRDIRDTNILITKDGIVKIIDFGFGKKIFFPNDTDKSISLNWWCDIPDEFSIKKYGKETEVYFAGKLFEYLLQQNQIDNFLYSSDLQMMIEKKKIRISGPFTVEALPAPAVRPLEDAGDGPAPFFHENAAKKQDDWMQELQAAGILGRGGERIQFSRVEALEGAKFLHASAETKEKDPRPAVICFAGETRPLDTRMVNQAMNEAEKIRPKPAYIIFAAFQFDPAAANLIEDTKWPGVTLLKLQMNTDLMTADLKKKSSASQSFWLVGQPDVDLIKIEKGDDQGKYKVKVKGFDYYDVKTGKVISGGTDKIALWLLDTDYDGMSLEPKQVFFPMEGKNEGWDKLARVLKAEIDQDLIEKYRGVESLPFAVKENTLVAVKIVDDRGIESLKIIPVGEK